MRFKSRVQFPKLADFLLKIIVFLLRIAHANGFTEEEIAERKAVIYSNTVTSMAAILKAMDNILQVPLDDPSKQVNIFLWLNGKNFVSFKL